jgi:hypothetical protein
MLDTIVCQNRVRTRMQNGPLGPYLTEYAAALSREGYADETIRQYLRTADRLGVWLLEQSLPLCDLRPSRLFATLTCPSRFTLSIGMNSLSFATDLTLNRDFHGFDFPFCAIPSR